MKLKLLRIAGLKIVLVCLAVSASGQNPDTFFGQYLFGYIGIDTQNLTEIEQNQIPANTVWIVSNATQDVRTQIDQANAHSLRAAINIEDALFRTDTTLNTPCGANSRRLRTDYQAKFSSWLNLNGSRITHDKVALLVLNTELNDRCIPYDSLNLAAQYVKSSVSSSPIPIIVGYAGGTGAQPLPTFIPPVLDGIGFLRYGVLDPRTDSGYQRDLTTLKSELTSTQRMILVPDGFWKQGSTWPQWYLGYVALNYASLALNDPKVVGLMIWTWTDASDPYGYYVGSRNLVQSARDRQRQAACSLGVHNPLVAPC